MTIRLKCGDGIVLRLPQEYFEKGVFCNPDIAKARSYTLQCKASSEVVNAVLDVVDDESEALTITEGNFEELRALCKELGFSKFDGALRAFATGHSGVTVASLEERINDVCRQNQAIFRLVLTRQEFLETNLEQLKNQINKHEQVLEHIQRQLDELVNEKLVVRIQALEEAGRICEDRNVQTSRSVEHALTECAKQSDLEELARDVARMKKMAKNTSRNRQWEESSGSWIPNLTASSRI